MEIVQTQVEIRKIETMADRGLKIIIGTPELDSASKTRLFDLQSTSAFMVLADREQDRVFVPETPMPMETSKKRSQSQRLRASLYRLWEAKYRHQYKDSEAFYTAKMEHLIRWVQDQIDG